MAQRQETEEFDPEEFFIRKMEEIPGTDLLILSMGAILGFNGYTPLTALLKVGGALGGTAQDSLQNILPNVGSSTWSLNLELLVARILLPGLQPTQDRAQQLKVNILGAMVGSLESYALTRPGVAVGIAEAIATAIPF